MMPDRNIGEDDAPEATPAVRIDRVDSPLGGRSLEDMGEPPKKPAAQKKKVELTRSWDFKCLITGKEGRFTAVIPTLRMRVQIAQIKAELAGVPGFDALDHEDKRLIRGLAHCRSVFIEKPEWFTDVLDGRFEWIIHGLAGVVLAHQQEWFLSLARVDGEGKILSAIQIGEAVGT